MEQLSDYLISQIKEELHKKSDESLELEDFKHIKNLNIVQPVSGDCLRGIDQLPNLEKLEVSSIGNTLYEDIKDGYSISDESIKSILQSENLKSLSIINQTQITSIDVTKLHKLENLNISQNKNLLQVKGLEKLEKLEELVCYGNRSLASIENLDEVIQKNSELYSTKLDVSLFPDAIGYNSKNHSCNEASLQKLEDIQTDYEASWIEIVGKSVIKINQNQMEDVHNKACSILKDLETNSDKDEKIILIEKYIAENITYSKELEEEQNDMKIRGARSNTNGMYTAIMNHKCRAEGYTKLMQYFLKLQDIHSEIINCGVINEHNNDIERYSLINVEGKFIDPCKNAIAYEEGDMSLPGHLGTQLKGYKFNIHNLEISNKLFENTKISDVKKIENEIGKDIKEHTKDETEEVRGI